MLLNEHPELMQSANNPLLEKLNKALLGKNEYAYEEEELEGILSDIVGQKVKFSKLEVLSYEELVMEKTYKFGKCCKNRIFITIESDGCDDEDDDKCVWTITHIRIYYK